MIFARADFATHEQKTPVKRDDAHDYVHRLSVYHYDRLLYSALCILSADCKGDVAVFIVDNRIIIAV